MTRQTGPKVEMSQLLLESSASRPVTQSPRARRSATPTTVLPQSSRALLTAWLLLFCERRPTHGYELPRQLEAHGVTTERLRDNRRGRRSSLRP